MYYNYSWLGDKPLTYKSWSRTMDIKTNEIADFLKRALPEDPNSRLLAWAEVAELQKKLKALEMTLRTELATHFCPNPKEGTNTVDLGQGWKVKVKHTLNRSVDEAALDAVLAEMPEGSKEALLKYKPDLKIAAYKALALSDKKVFDQAVTTKPGSPAMELVAPKV
jgi:hypothetical protein